MVQYYQLYFEHEKLMDTISIRSGIDGLLELSLLFSPSPSSSSLSPFSPSPSSCSLSTSPSPWSLSPSTSSSPCSLPPSTSSSSCPF